MKLSTRGRYGVRLMLDLALHYGEGPIFLKDIAERQGISGKYLWQLINPLKAMGLISSQRGAHGGYILGKHLRQGDPPDPGRLPVPGRLRGRPIVL